MKWIGQHIWDFVSRFRGDVYMENISTTTETSVLVIDSNNKISKNTKDLSNSYDFHSTTFENSYSSGEGAGKILKYSPGGDATIPAGQVFYLRSTGSWALADADAESSTAPLLGVGLGVSSQTGGLLLNGFIRVPSTEILNVPGSGAVDGLPVYLSTTAGHFDFTAPSASGDVVRILGYAIDDHSGDVLIYFNPDGTYIEIA